MKKLIYPIIKNGKDMDLIFYIFADGISTNLTPNWAITSYFTFLQIDNYLPVLIDLKDSYIYSYPHSFTSVNLRPHLLTNTIIMDIQKAYTDNKLEYPNEKYDFIKSFDDVNIMQLVAFQTKNQELIKWFYNLNGEHTDSALVSNITLTDDMLLLLLKRNPYKYVQFIDQERQFSKQILDFIIKQDKYLISELATTKNLDENAICYIFHHLDNEAICDLMTRARTPQYLLEFIAYHISDFSKIIVMKHNRPELNFIIDSFINYHITLTSD